MVTKETFLEVWLRDHNQCQNPDCKHLDNTFLEAHHIYWRQKYKGKDRDEAWNLILLCNECHKDGMDSVHKSNKELDQYLRNIADQRKAPHLRETERHSDLDRAKSLRQKDYKNKLNKFKQANGGLSPSQVEYRRLKALTLKQS